MYPGGRDQRNHDIEAGAGRPAAELAADVTATAAQIEAVWAEMPAQAWAGRGLTIAGELAMADLVFIRWREVTVHHADLGLGYSWSDWDTEYVRLELARLTMLWASRKPMGMTDLPPQAMAVTPHQRVALAARSSRDRRPCRCGDHFLMQWKRVAVGACAGPCRARAGPAGVRPRRARGERAIGERGARGRAAQHRARLQRSGRCRARRHRALRPGCEPGRNRSAGEHHRRHGRAGVGPGDRRRRVRGRVARSIRRWARRQRRVQLPGRRAAGCRRRCTDRQGQRRRHGRPPPSGGSTRRRAFWR